MSHLIIQFITYKKCKKYVGVSAENSQSGTSVRLTQQTYSGIRARQVLYQMFIMMLANGKRKPTVFKAYYDCKVEEGNWPSLW
ncbi:MULTISPECIES: IS110 family transposase [unclassified Bacillus cereus group]|uniref:IS110 family transposase n=1 Tax=unclassified Bacillus cereus group TaxID=2750818 RepID=UPI001F589E4D|nr:MULTISPECIES: IS110 family transposase [unclassified Bacillus cereus group]